MNPETLKAMKESWLTGFLCGFGVGGLIVLLVYVLAASAK